MNLFVEVIVAITCCVSTVNGKSTVFRETQQRAISTTDEGYLKSIQAHSSMKCGRQCSALDVCHSASFNRATSECRLSTYWYEDPGGQTDTDIDSDFMQKILSCLNGGALKNEKCSCPSGFTGNQCQTKEINECMSNPCANAATCVDVVNGYNCICVAGYNGTHSCPTDYRSEDAGEQTICFKVVKGGYTYYQGKATCNGDGGYLLRVNNMTIWNMMAGVLNEATYAGGVSYWVDGSEEGHIGTWKYSDGSLVPWTNWETKQPSGSSENCMIMHRPTSLTIHDCSCTHQQEYICQIDV